MKKVQPPTHAKAKQPLTPTKQQPPVTRLGRNGSTCERKRSTNADSIESLLSPETARMMASFTAGQRKIIEKQFNKMMKNIQKKIASPQKNIETQTLRADLAEFTECNVQTARKGNFSDRNAHSPKAKSKSRNLGVISPNQKKTKKNWSTQPPPNKTTSTLSGVKSPSKKKVPKTARNVCHHRQSNYFLFGDQFIQLNKQEAKNYQQEILLSAELSVGFDEDRDSELEDAWKRHMGGEKRKDRIQSAKGSMKNCEQILHQPTPQKQDNEASQENAQDYSFSIKDLKEDAADISRIIFSCKSGGDISSPNKKSRFGGAALNQSRTVVSPQDNQEQHVKSFHFIKELQEELKNQTPEPTSSKPRLVQSPDLNEDSCYMFESEENLSPVKTKSPLQIQSPAPATTQHEDLIQMRINVVNIQMKTNKGILDQLLGEGKITRREHQFHLDLVMESYEKEMGEIESLKRALDESEHKVEEIILETRNNLKLTQSSNEVDAKEILEQMFKNIRSNSKSCVSEFYSGQAGKGLSSPQEPISPNSRNSVFEDCEETYSIQEVNHHKEFISGRIASQLGLIQTKHTGPNQVNTSVAAIYQFMKVFFTFLIKNYQNEFLRMVNMPYGYSVNQRLLMMQGYEEEFSMKEDQDGVIYGVQEVIRNEIFERFCSQYLPNTKDKNRQYESIHCSAIFDAINESLNEFRPYYSVNGPPYIWSTSEKGLTFFYIEEGNIGEVLEKTQMEVLKAASSLCGIIYADGGRNQHPQGTPVQSIGSQKEILELQTIFQHYTNSIPEQILKERENRLIKKQYKEVTVDNYEWLNFDEYQTALFYEISSLILEDLADQVTLQFKGYVETCF